MAKHLGRKVILKKGAAPFACVRTKTLQINRELVDSTDSCSEAWAEHLDEPGQIDVSMSLDGVFSDADAMTEALNPAAGNEAYSLEYPDGGIVSGSFGITSFGNENPHQDVSTYTIELRATGAVTYTPPVGP